MGADLFPQEGAKMLCERRERCCPCPLTVVSCLAVPTFPTGLQASLPPSTEDSGSAQWPVQMQVGTTRHSGFPGDYERAGQGVGSAGSREPAVCGRSRGRAGWTLLTQELKGPVLPSCLRGTLDKHTTCPMQECAQDNCLETVNNNL